MAVPADKEKKIPSNDKDKKRLQVLGPVDQLEPHVRPDWWNRIFNSLYLKTDGDVVEDQEITKGEVTTYGAYLGLQEGEKLLALCCGQGRHALEWSRRGITVYGMDRSRFLIGKARSRAKAEGLNPNLREGDARKLPYGADSFEVVTILGNSFGYFESAQDDLQVLQEVRRVLKPEGRIMLDVSDGDFVRSTFAPRSWEWIDKNMFVCRERSLAADGQRLISREVITHVRKGVVADQFYAERLYSREGLEELLKKAGFSKITFHGEMIPDSKRNQDLGMMSRRFVVTATLQKSWAPKRKATPATTKKVAVFFYLVF